MSHPRAPLLPFDDELGTDSEPNHPLARPSAEASTEEQGQLCDDHPATPPVAEADVLNGAPAAEDADDPAPEPESGPTEGRESGDDSPTMEPVEQAGVAVPADDDDHRSPPAVKTEVLPDLPTLASRINEALSETDHLVRTSLRRAVELGESLLEAKKQLGHGKFTPWLAGICPRLSPRSARVYMQLAKNLAHVDLADESNRQTIAVLTIQAALRFFAKPRTEPTSVEIPGPRLAIGYTPSHVAADEVPDADQRESEETERDGLPGDRSDQNVVRAHPGVPSQPEDFRHRDTNDAGRDQQPDDPEPGDQEPPPVVHHAQVEEPEPAPLDETDVEDESRPSSAGADEIHDEEDWLKSLPIRPLLEDPAIFDEQALLWRRLQPGIDQLRRLFRPSEEDTRGAAVLSWLRKRYAYCAAFLIGVKPPGEWQVCPSCDGTGRSKYLRKPCDQCSGSGVRVTHEGDYPDDPPVEP